MNKADSWYISVHSSPPTRLPLFLPTLPHRKLLDPLNLPSSISLSPPPTPLSQTVPQSTPSKPLLLLDPNQNPSPQLQSNVNLRLPLFPSPPFLLDDVSTPHHLFLHPNSSPPTPKSTFKEPFKFDVLARGNRRRDGACSREASGSCCFSSRVV